MKNKNLILLHHLFITVLIPFVQNCFTITYQKNFDPFEQGDYKKEFPQKNNIQIGSLIQDASSQKIHGQFQSMMVGDDRILNLVIDLQSKSGYIYDGADYKNTDTTAVIICRGSSFYPSVIFNNSDRLVTTQELGLDKNKLPENFPVFGLSHYDIWLMELQKSKENPDVYVKKSVPQSFRHNSEKISWRVRSREGYMLAYTAFYSGYILTVPLDIITAPIQFVIYLSSGGVK